MVYIDSLNNLHVYFNIIAYGALSSISNRFIQFKIYNSNFGFFNTTLGISNNKW